MVHLSDLYPFIDQITPSPVTTKTYTVKSYLICLYIQVDCVLKLWKNGFSVDDGPLRDFKADENREFLDSISKG